MKVLVIDTALNACTAAVFDGSTALPATWRVDAHEIGADAPSVAVANASMSGDVADPATSNPAALATYVATSRRRPGTRSRMRPADSAPRA